MLFMRIGCEWRQVTEQRRVLLRRGQTRVRLAVFTGLLWLSGTCQAFENYSCTAQWFDTNVDDSIGTRRGPDRTETCRKEPTPARTFGYRVVDGKVYWGRTNTTRSSPCTAGGVGSMGQVLNPVCWLPRALQVHETHENRHFWLVSQDGAHFRTAPSAQAELTASQQDDLSRYAVDRTSVYYSSKKIEGADPETFEVFFPDGVLPHGNEYSFARDSRHLFVDGWSLPLFDPTEVTWLELPCMDDKFSMCHHWTIQAPILGRLVDDLLVLGKGTRPTLFKDLLKSDVTCSLDGVTAYCIIDSQRYLIDFKGVEPARLVLQDGQEIIRDTSS
jgi:hypothetical protein